jgi:hypothetical protein
MKEYIFYDYENFRYIINEMRPKQSQKQNSASRSSTTKKTKSNVIKTQTFAKRKLKPGRVLHHDNFTNTSFKAKSIFIPQQLKASSSSSNIDDQSEGKKPKTSLTDLCRLLSHQNEKVVRSTLAGMAIIELLCHFLVIFRKF